MLNYFTRPYCKIQTFSLRRQEANIGRTLIGPAAQQRSTLPRCSRPAQYSALEGKDDAG